MQPMISCFRIKHGVHEGEEVFLPGQDLGNPADFLEQIDPFVFPHECYKSAG